ncbi:D-2-hydroxyacid dehydrogenase [Hyunsoonleella sp. SJ7]|uniref:D-2-hydroxyacid dehydrogenase n=1 Tax=Hyunsoonleella aquatilis TaxID=2762758 RepID=A0A923H8R8_9FLAO|nr:D-2-hydroxyacid dehydrogenase [Hyunsoonleella aquatilis]MBC3757594.1 D-2-hydroxyacid dehydrogenase [Hyunsoonleella aquatilis]
MKIVVLDGYTLNPGDLNWDGIAQFGDINVFDRTLYNDDAIIENIGDAEIIFTNKTPLNSNILSQAPSIKYIGVLATGYNIVDIATARKSGITVTNVPDYSSSAVAQFTMALTLELCHRIGDHNASVKNGDWVKSRDFSYWNYPLIELSGKTLGLIGFGKIAKATAKLAQAFGMKILVYNRTIYSEYENESLEFVSLNELLQDSDFVSLHSPLTTETKGIIKRETISKMKHSAFLINTARGPLVVEKDLADALNNGTLAGAALDVISEEPMKKDNPLLQTENCIITPHIAWASKEARQRLMMTTVENLKSYLNGKPQNVVN